MIELYHAPQSTCSQKVRICLAEKDLDWTDRRVNLGKNENLTPDYLALNPNGVVPTLVHDGQVIVDSSVICEYLDETFPTPRLVPDDAIGRARMRAWMRYLEEVPTAAVRVPSFNMALLTRFSGQDDADFKQNEAAIRPIRKHFYERMGTKGFSESDFRNSLEQIVKTCARVDAALEDGPWLLGELYSIADIVLAPSLDRMADLGFSHLWERDYSRVTDWLARIRARPAVQKAFFPGSRMSESYELGAPTVARL
jgi:glutathione S-transferase